MVPSVGASSPAPSSFRLDAIDIPSVVYASEEANSIDFAASETMDREQPQVSQEQQKVIEKRVKRYTFLAAAAAFTGAALAIGLAVFPPTSPLAVACIAAALFVGFTGGKMTSDFVWGCVETRRERQNAGDPSPLQQQALMKNRVKRYTHLAAGLSSFGLFFAIGASFFPPAAPIVVLCLVAASGCVSYYTGKVASDFAGGALECSRDVRGVIEGIRNQDRAEDLEAGHEQNLADDSSLSCSIDSEDTGLHYFGRQDSGTLSGGFYDAISLSDSMTSFVDSVELESPGRGDS